MEIDIRTLILIIGVAHLMQVLVFFHQYKTNRDLSGPGWWLLWSAAECIGFVLILFRSIPTLLTGVIVFQNVIILSGTIFVYIGVKRFFNKKINLKFIVSLFVSYVTLHLYFLFVNNSIEIRTLLLDAYLSVVAFLTAIGIYKNKTPAIASTAIFNTIIFTVHGSVFAYRTVMIILGVSVTDVFSSSLFNLIQYFDALLAGLLWTFGFIMMLNQRLNIEILEAKSHFEQIFNTSPDAAVITRLSDGKFVDCNEGYTRISGYTKEDISGKSSIEINIWKNPDDRDEVVRMIQEKGFFENYELLFQRKNGEVITGLMSATVIALNEIPHIISVTRDISDRKQNEIEIHQKNEELHKLNAEKDKFFSIIAHDLRGPFGNFLLLTQIMAEDLPGLSTSEIQEIAESMRNSATNLFGLLENMLQWARMQQGLIPFEPVVTELLPIVDESIALIVEPAKNKGIDLTCYIPADINVFADRNMLQTVIRNLVSNAVKFTPRGGKISLLAKITDDKSVEISIKDTGIGMSHKMVEDLFKIDVQTNRKGTEGEPSTGLGLLLCKEFTEKQDGKILVVSEENKGSTLYILLPKPEVND